MFTLAETVVFGFQNSGKSYALRSDKLFDLSERENEMKTFIVHGKVNECLLFVISAFGWQLGRPAEIVTQLPSLVAYVEHTYVLSLFPDFCEFTFSGFSKT